MICQRARAKAESGIDVPPPPSLVPPAAGVQGPVAGVHITPCGPGRRAPACQGQVVMTGPTTIVENQTPGLRGDRWYCWDIRPNAPGYAVVGGLRWSGRRSGPDRRRQESQPPWRIRPPNGRGRTSTGLESI